MLIPVERVLTRDEVAAFRARLDAASWRDGLVTAGTLARSVKRNLQLEDGSPLATELGNEVLRRLQANSLFVSAALPRRIYPPKFNRYADGGTYGAHVDSALMQVPGAGLTVRSDLSATLFLCDPDEYEGGELQIEGPFGVQSVRLPAGDTILYPSSSLHRVTPVTRGARIASFFWIESLVRDDAARALLFDLGRAIQGRTPALRPDEPHLLSLSGVYHNLLRRWASP